MLETLKIEFIDDNSFTVYYITKDRFTEVEDYKIMFKYINEELEEKYNYTMHGYYDVNVYTNENIYILDFIYIDDYGRRDFNVSIFLNSKILYKFYDSDLINGIKYYYNDSFYVDINSILNDIRLYEYGSIVYGDEAELIIRKAITVK